MALTARIKIKIKKIKGNLIKADWTEPTRELMNARKTSLRHNKKDPSRIRYLSLDMQINTRYINSTRGAHTSGFQARSKDQEILEEGGGAGPST